MNKQTEKCRQKTHKRMSEREDLLPRIASIDSQPSIFLLKHRTKIVCLYCFIGHANRRFSEKDQEIYE